MFMGWRGDVDQTVMCTRRCFPSGCAVAAVGCGVLSYDSTPLCTSLRLHCLFLGELACAIAWRLERSHFAGACFFVFATKEFTYKKKVIVCSTVVAPGSCLGSVEQIVLAMLSGSSDRQHRVKAVTSYFMPGHNELKCVRRWIESITPSLIMLTWNATSVGGVQFTCNRRISDQSLVGPVVFSS